MSSLQHYRGSLGEYQYLAALRACVEQGDRRGTRNAVTSALFGHQMKFDMAHGFPLLTTKRVHWKSVVAELLWFLRGETNVRSLQAEGVTIWDEWADENGDLGPVYGSQWRSWPTGKKGPFVVTSYASNGEPCAGYKPDITIDQIKNVIESLRNDPYGRRHIVTAWNPAEIDKMALPPCHMTFQFFVRSTGHLDLGLYQRSADMFLGVPFNIASYALLLHLMAREVGLEPGVFTHTLGDYHLYDNHVDQAKLQLTRSPRKLPALKINPYPFRKSIFELQTEDVQLDGYEPHPAIKAEVTK